MKSIEIFAGAGGLGLGVDSAGIKPICVVERDKYCCDTLRENTKVVMKHDSSWNIHETDVRDFDYGAYDGHIDLVTGGPPCQPFSLGGKHKANRDDRDMFPEAVRAIRELRPRAFIFENVKGMTRTTFANYYEYVFLQLSYPEIKKRKDEQWEGHLARLEAFHTGKGVRGLCYRVVRRVLNAANYGIPQKRERVFFVGFRSDLGVEWNFPDETHSLKGLLWDIAKGDYWDRHEISKRNRVLEPRYEKMMNNIKARDCRLPWCTVRDALSDLPDPEFEPHRANEFLNHKFQPGAKSYPGHTGSVFDLPAKTLKAGVHGVPGGENMLRRSDGSVRYFTVRESARLQTFPDDFVFHGSWTETMRQLGNAVPVQLASIVAGKVKMELEALGGK